MRIRIFLTSGIEKLTQIGWNNKEMFVVTLFSCSWKSKSLADVRIIWCNGFMLSPRTKVPASSTFCPLWWCRWHLYACCRGTVPFGGVMFSTVWRRGNCFFLISSLGMKKLFSPLSLTGLPVGFHSCLIGQDWVSYPFLTNQWQRGWVELIH